MDIQKKIITFIILFFILHLIFLHSVESNSSVSQQEPPQITERDLSLLKLLGITPSEESIDYIQDKTQFQLHTLLTEQRHPKTWNLSQRIKDDYKAGLSMLFSVDEDITKKLNALTKEMQNIELATRAIKEAILSGNKIYIYGCGATGRLAKQMESTFWRPFWNKIKESNRLWKKIELLSKESIEGRLIGEMTGGDRALISSLEGFEDLLLIGRLQLEDRGIKKGDVVICVTEGGETSSVIGTVLAALDQWKQADAYDPKETKKRLFYVYNNPDEKLLPFHRSRRVIDEPGITKINLTTGPQSITGSTRMQATTIETFVIATILQSAIDRTLRNFLSQKEMSKIGFEDVIDVEESFNSFSRLLKKVKRTIPATAKFTEIESQTYEAGNFTTYFAQKGLITVFIDSTERSPTFRLFPLDTVQEKSRKCWIQVWTPAQNLKEAWQAFLGRPFKGLSPSFYRNPFSEKIEDPYLKKAALESLKNAGDDQQNLYDFSFADFNMKNRGPGEGDLGVLVLLSPEESELKNIKSDFRKFLDLFLNNKNKAAIIVITNNPEKDIQKIIREIPNFDPKGKDSLVVVNINDQNDPLGINQQIALKIILNAHSTAVMARLGKVIGNTMTNVSPSNLKLIGRATYLIQSHVNDVLNRPQWVKQYGIQKPISYGEANAVLFEAIRFLKDKKTIAGQTAEVALSIIWILESLRLRKGLTQEEAFEIVKDTGLSQYLSAIVASSSS